MIIRENIHLGYLPVVSKEIFRFTQNHLRYSVKVKSLRKKLREIKLKSNCVKFMSVDINSEMYANFLSN